MTTHQIVELVLNPEDWCKAVNCDPHYRVPDPPAKNLIDPAFTRDIALTMQRYDLQSWKNILEPNVYDALQEITSISTGTVSPNDSPYCIPRGDWLLQVVMDIKSKLDERNK